MAARALPGWVGDGARGAVLRIRAKPGASRPGIQGLHGGALAVRVRARPVDGAANRELLAVIADALDVAPSRLALEAGAGGREKRVRVEGLDAATVVARLASRGVP